MKNLFKSKEERVTSNHFYYDELKNYIDKKILIFEQEALLSFNKLNFKYNLIDLEVSLNNRDGYSEVISDEDENLLYLKEVYVDLDYFERKKLKDMVFKAKIEISDFVYDLKFVLERDIRYLREYEKIEEVMYLNNKVANLKNNILFDRMYRIKILSLPEDLSLNDVSFNEKIEFDFGEFSEKIQLDKYLYWNIQKQTYIPDKLVKPSLKNIYHQYEFETEADYDYLVDEQERDVFGIVASEEKFTIYSTNSDKMIWNFIKLSKLEDSGLNITRYNITNVFNLNSLILQDDFLRGKIEIKEISKKGDKYIFFEEEENPHHEVLYLKVDKKSDDYFYFDRLLYLVRLLRKMEINCRVVI